MPLEIDASHEAETQAFKTPKDGKMSNIALQAHTNKIIKKGTTFTKK